MADYGNLAIEVLIKENAQRAEEAGVNEPFGDRD